MAATGKPFNIDKRQVYEAFIVRRSNPMEVRLAWTVRLSRSSKPT